MSSQQHHPHLHHDTTEYQIKKGHAWLVIAVFAVMMMIPPVVEHIRRIQAGESKLSPAGQLLSWRPGQEPLIDRLHAVEKKLDDSFYSTAIRRGMQGILVRKVGEGNRKVFVGYDGWLFYQPDLDALTGFGPLRPEPFSVMKDPELAKLPETKDVILGFADQLKDRGVKLLIVPVPLKPMIYGEYVTPEENREWVTHPDAPQFYEELRKHGIGVLDLTADIAKLRTKRKHIFVRVPDRKDKEGIKEAEEDAKKTQQAFLMQDTHWTPEAMRLTAERVASVVKQSYPEALQPGAGVIRATDGAMRESRGDLVKLLDINHPEQTYDTEEAFLRFIGEGTESKDSPIVLLGDSFVNIFDDPTLGFEDATSEESKKRLIRAGFAQNLSLLLQQPLDVIAMNGKGSTGVRQEFAKKYDDEVRNKKLVIWVIASRDFLLSRTAAHRANIDWAHVKFNPNRSPAASATPATGDSPPPAGAETLVIEAKLAEKSKNQDPSGTPYADALHTAIYDVDQVVSGALDAKQVMAIQWTFKNKQMQPTADATPGRRYRLTLVPWADRQELRSLNRSEDVLSFDLPEYFVEKLEPLP